MDYPIAPTDANGKVRGTWKLDKDGKIVVAFLDPVRKPLILELVSCDGKVLKIK